MNDQDLKLSLKDFWQVCKLAFIAGMAFQFGQWVVDTLISNLE